MKEASITTDPKGYLIIPQFGHPLRIGPWPTLECSHDPGTALSEVLTATPPPGALPWLQTIPPWARRVIVEKWTSDFHIAVILRLLAVGGVKQGRAICRHANLYLLGCEFAWANGLDLAALGPLSPRALARFLGIQHHDLGALALLRRAIKPVTVEHLHVLRHLCKRTLKLLLQLNTLPYEIVYLLHEGLITEGDLDLGLLQLIESEPDCLSVLDQIIELRKSSECTWPYRGIRTTEDLERILSRLRRPERNTLLPAPCFSALLEVDDFQMVRLTTAEAVHEESHEMEHCLDQLLPFLLTGEAIAYSVFLPDRATLVIRQDPGRHWYIEGLVGQANQPVGPAMRETVERWVESLNLRGGNR